MPIKILIKRIVPAQKEKELLPLLMDLRSHAAMQPGYIAGETLRRLDNPGEELVISAWRSLEDWRTWVTSRERTVLQEKIDRLLMEETHYEIYIND